MILHAHDRLLKYKCKLNVYHNCQMHCQLKGDVLVELLTKAGWISSRYERYVSGDKMFIVSYYFHMSR